MTFNRIPTDAEKLPSIKTKEEIALMRVAGRIVYEVLCELEKMAEVGRTTMELSDRAKEMTLARGATPLFEGYKGFKHPICISLNAEVAHGSPSPKVKLVNGDLLKLDFGVRYEGFCADSARTVIVGKSHDYGDERLAGITRDALYAAIDQCRPGKRVGDISAAITMVGAAHDLGIVRDLTGHGIGRNLHEHPPIPNVGEGGVGMQLRPGMTIAIEPMFNMGRAAVHILDDGWTVVTTDGSNSAHWEHTVLITDGDPEVLTLPKD